MSGTFFTCQNFVIYLAVSLRMMLRHRVNQTTEEEYLRTEKNSEHSR